MLRGDLQLSPTPIYDPLSGNPDGTGRTQFQVLPGDPNYALCDTATNPELPQHHSRGAGWIPSRSRSRATFPPTTSTGSKTTTSCPRPFAFDRHQLDSKVDFNVNPKFNLAGHLRRPALPDLGADRLRGRRRRASPSAAAAIPGTATAIPTGSPSWAHTSSRRRS